MADIEIPATRYARSGDLRIAYQVVGDAALDLVYVPGWISNVERGWDEPSYARFLRRLASFARVILFDKRGTGLSDRVAEQELPTLEQRMDDVRAVMDAAGSERAALLGVSEGGPMSLLFAATYPDRTSALVVYGSYARRGRSADYPWGRSSAEQAEFMREIDEEWGGPVALAQRAPSRMNDRSFVDWWSMYLRQSASPSAVRVLTEMNYQVDVRGILSSIHVPTLVLHRAGDRIMKTAEACFIADQVPGAKLVVLDGGDHLPWVGDQDAIVDEIEEFLTGVRPGADADRVLATILFIDLVRSTDRAAELGDRHWRQLLDSFHARAAEGLTRFRGRLVSTTGDGFLATFDGPARGVRCAQAVLASTEEIGLQARAGVHTGEVELSGSDIRGIAVHLAARVMASAAPGEVRVSSTVRDLVAGSGIEFEDLGQHRLKGIPDTWRLFAAR